MEKEIEIEKKYKLKRLPDNLENYEHMEIEQSYLNKGGAPIRLRKFKKEEKIICIFSKKVKEENKELEKVEYNMELTEHLYNEFLKAKEGRTISKTRYKVPITENLIIEIDAFHDFFEGMYIAEIEFLSEEQARNYKVPDWLEEIDDSKKYSNNYMATEAKDINEYKDLML